jgi:lipopolysaccharide transport system ATP-binding protein
VSHSMPAVLRLCERVILLDHGGVAADGGPPAVVGRYMRADVGGQAEMTWPSAEQAPGDEVARLRAVRVRDQRGQLAETIEIREPVCVEVEYWNLQSRLRPTVSIHFVNEEGTCLFASSDFSNREWWGTPRVPGVIRATCEVPGNLLAEGRVYILAAVATYNPNVIHAIERDAVSFQVIDRSAGDAVRGEFIGAWPGVVRPMLSWEIATEC